jgi:hypothetical protein
MKKVKFEKKLTLKKEAITKLNIKQANRVKGGVLGASLNDKCAGATRAC